MAIVYDAPSNTITVTGYTEGVPCTFLDVWNADQAGGWGVVAKQGTHQFELSCKIKVGDGVNASYLGDVDVQIVFVDGIVTAAGENLFELTANSFTTFGTLVSAADKTSKQGIDILNLESTSWVYLFRGAGRLYLYSSSASSPDAEANFRLYNSVNRRYNCLFKVGVNDYPPNAGTDYNLLFASASCGFAGSGDSDRIIVTDNTYVVRTYGADNLTVSNLLAQGCTFIGRFSGAGTTTLIDTTSNTWAFSWVAGVQTRIIYRQYTMNIQVVDTIGTPISGATVTLKDKNGNVVFTEASAADGTIAEQTVSRGYYTQATGDIIQEYSPHMLTVEKTGYVTLSTTFPLESPVDWIMVLLKVAPSGGVASRRVKVVPKEFGEEEALLAGLYVIERRKRRKHYRRFTLSKETLALVI